MKRLIKHSMKKTSRLRRRILAEWEQLNPSDPDIIEKVTDSMTHGFPMQINYQGSGWRTIQPYGWDTSKDGNILLRCYKDTGEVRSYRFDRIEDIYIDTSGSGVVPTTNNDQMNDDAQMQIYENIMNEQSETDYDMPPLPEENKKDFTDEIGEFDDELQILQDQPINQEVQEEVSLENIEQDIITEETENIDQESEEINNDEEQI